MIGPDVHWWTCKAEKEGLQSVCNITRSRKDDMSPLSLAVLKVTFRLLDWYLELVFTLPKTSLVV